MLAWALIRCRLSLLMKAGDRWRDRTFQFVTQAGLGHMIMFSSAGRPRVAAIVPPCARPRLVRPRRIRRELVLRGGMAAMPVGGVISRARRKAVRMLPLVYNLPE